MTMIGSAEIEARLNELLDSAQKWKRRAEAVEEALDAAVFQLDQEQARADFLQDQVDALTRERPAAQPAPAPGPAAPPSPAAPAVHRAYGTLEEWVGDWLSVHIEKPPSNRFRWCTRWREHPEALLRLEVMFGEYTRALADPRIGMGNFIRSGLDHHVPRLLAADGPFAACDPDHHEPPARLPAAGPPTETPC